MGQVLLIGIVEIVEVWWARVWSYHVWVIGVGWARFCLQKQFPKSLWRIF